MSKKEGLFIPSPHQMRGFIDEINCCNSPQIMSKVFVETLAKDGYPVVFKYRTDDTWYYWDIPVENYLFDWQSFDYAVVTKDEVKYFQKYNDFYKTEKEVDKINESVNRICETRKSEETFTKADNGKLQWSLMPFEQLEDVVRVLMKGAETYSKDNWKKCDDTTRYVDALERHVVSYIKGEKVDVKEKGGDGLPHLAHAICNCLFLMYFDNKGIEE